MFAVLKVKVRSHRDLVTVVGSLASVTAGEWINAEGRWIQDPEFGQQFRAELLTSTPPTTREGIEKYLGSGMVKGIGPVYAKKLVGQFGEAIFDVIEKESARLEQIDGIGPRRRKRIKEAWAEQKVIHNDSGKEARGSDRPAKSARHGGQEPRHDEAFFRAAGAASVRMNGCARPLPAFQAGPFERNGVGHPGTE